TQRTNQLRTISSSTDCREKAESRLYRNRTIARRRSLHRYGFARCAGGRLAVLLAGRDRTLDALDETLVHFDKAVPRIVTVLLVAGHRQRGLAVLVRTCLSGFGVFVSIAVV